MIEIIFWVWLGGGCLTAAVLSFLHDDFREDAVWWMVFWPFAWVAILVAITKEIARNLIAGWHL